MSRPTGKAPFAEGSLQHIRLTYEGPVSRLVLARPEKLNALNPLMRDELVWALDDIKGRQDVNCVVIAAQGRAFSAGVDVDTSYFFNDVDDESIYAGRRLLTEQHEVISSLYDLPQVTVAAIQGDAVGGFGFGLAMACDLRVAVRGARFWMIPSHLDVIQDFGLTWLVQQQIGTSRTLEMALRGEPLAAEAAQSVGLVNRVVGSEADLDVAVDRLVATVASAGVDSTRMLKTIVRTGSRLELRDQLAVEAISNGLAFQSETFRAKHATYLGALKKRAPRS